jgi:hypothetical protein
MGHRDQSGMLGMLEMPMITRGSDVLPPVVT